MADYKEKERKKNKNKLISQEKFPIQKMPDNSTLQANTMYNMQTAS